MKLKFKNTFTIALKSMKYLGIHLTKDVKRLHTENYKTLLRKNRGPKKKWQDLLCHNSEN